MIPFRSSSPTPVLFRRFHPILKRISPWFNGLTVLFFLSWLAGRWLGRWYPFELFSHFDVQYHALAINLMVGHLVFGLLYPQRARSGWVLIPFALLAGVVYFNDDRWTPGDVKTGDFTSTPPGDLRVFHANVLYIRRDFEPTLALLRQTDPHFYVLQEMTPRSIRLVTARLRDTYPHWFACWSKGPCWTLVGSRTPIRVDGPLARRMRIIRLTTRIDHRAVALVTVHPRTPLLLSWFRERNAQLRQAAQITRRNPHPTILIGDFNISVFSPLYDDLFRPTRPDDVKSVTTDGILRPGRFRLTQPTWPTFFWPMQLPLDHAFMNAGLYPIRFQTLDHPGSDHRAVVVDVRFAR